MTTALPYIIRPIGGTAWSVARGDEHLGTIYAGQPDGEWDEDAIMAAATAGDFPIVDDDGAVIIDGVTVREADAPDPSDLVLCRSDTGDGYGIVANLLDALETIVRIAKGDMRSGTHYDLKACAEVAEAALVKTRPTP